MSYAEIVAPFIFYGVICGGYMIRARYLDRRYARERAAHNSPLQPPMSGASDRNPSV